MVQPRYPIYIPSRGRWDTRYTAKALDAIGVPFTVIVEQDEFDAYASVIDPAKLAVLPERYLDEFDPCDGLGRTKILGPAPVRNYAWDHAQSIGAPWHWTMDDNIHGFYVLNRNRKLSPTNGWPIAAMEDFASRYRNVAMAGPAYYFFTKSRQKLAPFVTGTRIFSCQLIRTAAPFRWRARYNDDVDLSLRMLKAGWNTVQFNTFLQRKSATRRVRGGSTDELYGGVMGPADGTLEKSQMIVDLHPDVARLQYRFNRAHHFVDYSQWRNMPLIADDDAPPPRHWATLVLPTRDAASSDD